MLTEQTLYNGHPTLQAHYTVKGLSPAALKGYGLQGGQGVQ